MTKVMTKLILVVFLLRRNLAHLVELLVFITFPPTRIMFLCIYKTMYTRIKIIFFNCILNITVKKNYSLNEETSSSDDLRNLSSDSDQ